MRDVLLRRSVVSLHGFSAFLLCSFCACDGDSYIEPLKDAVQYGV